MPITAKLDELGLPAWIALMMLGFMVWWPLGLGILAFIIGSGRMGCGRHSVERWENKMARMQDKIERMRGRGGQSGSVSAAGADSRRRAAIGPSTNIAPRRCAGWKTSSANSGNSSTACASPRTRPSSTSSWPSAATGTAHRRSPRRADRVRSRSLNDCARPPPDQAVAVCISAAYSQRPR